MDAAQSTDNTIKCSAPDASEPLLLTLSNTCHKLGISAATAWRLIGRGDLESVVIGRRRLVRYASIKALAENGTPARRAA